MSTNDMPFNPESLLGANYEEANSTELVPLPDGDYLAVSDPITAESFKQFDITKGERAGQKGLMLFVGWNISDDDGKLKEALGRSPKIRQSIMLDVTKDGGLEFGKGRNVSLGRLREALGQNGNGRPWTWSMLGGQAARIKVGKKGEYTNVLDVAKAS